MKVSIIIPAHNAEKTLPACLAALQSQAGFAPDEYEVLVVDDGSTDKTAVIVQNAPHAKLIQHETKQGAAAGRNSAAAAAQGELLCFTDADCVPNPDWLQQLTAPFANLNIAGCKGIYRTEQKEFVARFVQLEYEDKYDLLRQQAQIDFIDTYSAAYRADVFHAANGFDEHVFYVEDQELSFRLAAEGHDMRFQETAVVAHNHANTLWRYARKKFMIGYWKTQILRRFPARAVQDSHTPQVMKLQIALVALGLLLLPTPLLTRWGWLPLGVVDAAFLLTTLPFVRKAWGKDRVVALLSPLLLLVRAAALGFGTLWGIVNPEPTVGKRRAASAS